VKRALQIVKPWLPAIAYMATIVIASSQPTPAFDMGYVPLRDKGVHFIEFGVLAILIAYALTTRRTSAGEPLTVAAIAKLALWAIALTTIFGYLDELHQAFVPGRNSDALDLLADFLGSIAGTAIYFMVKLAIARKRSRSAA
jgi:VanZ family protein